MMDKFWYMVGFSLKKRMATKSFLIVNIILFVVVLLLTNIVTIIKAFGGDFDRTTTVYIQDETNVVYEELSIKLTEITSFTCTDCYEFEEIEKVNINEVDLEDNIYIIVKPDVDSVLTTQVHAKEKIGNNLNIALNTSLNQIKVSTWLKDNYVEGIENLFNPVQIGYNYEDSSNNHSEALQGMAMVFVLPIFILIVFSLQFLGLDIIDEKASKSIEIIISNVKATHHFFAKLLSTLIFMTTQGLLFFIYGVIGLVVLMITTASNFSFGEIKAQVIGLVGDPAIAEQVNSIFDKLPIFVVIIVAFVIFGYLAYSIICAVIASMSTSTEDYSQMQAPLMMLLLLAFYSAIFSFMFNGALFIKILAYIPIISPMLAPVLYFGNHFSATEVAISFAILIAFDALILKYGIKLYRTSILSYNDDRFFKRLLKTIKMTSE